MPVRKLVNRQVCNDVFFLLVSKDLEKWHTINELFVFVVLQAVDCSQSVLKITSVKRP
jgi:hypothetical protein